MAVALILVVMTYIVATVLVLRKQVGVKTWPAWGRIGGPSIIGCLTEIDIVLVPVEQQFVTNTPLVMATIGPPNIAIRPENAIARSPSKIIG